MPKKDYALYFLATVLFAMISCGAKNEIGQQIEQQLINTRSERIDLSMVGGNAWKNVCIFGPYSTNEAARKVLGFKWDIESETNIARMDTINVIAFATDIMVLSYTEYPRGKGDFSQLSGKCFERDSAVFVRDKNRPDYLTFAHGR